MTLKEVEVGQTVTVKKITRSRCDQTKNYGYGNHKRCDGKS